MSISNQAAVAGAPGVLTLGGLTLLVSKPSAQDLITVHRWVHSHSFADVDGRGISSAELELLKPAERLILLREYAKAKTQKREPTDAEVLELLSSPDGVAMQVWLASRRHQDITRDQLRALITDDNCERVAEQLDLALGVNDEDGDPKKPDGGASAGSISSTDSPSPS